MAPLKVWQLQGNKHVEESPAYFLTEFYGIKRIVEFEFNCIYSPGSQSTTDFHYGVIMINQKRK